ncbi:MAG: hypothetical protein JXR51_00115 [Bacteroidales bacterium]|nr:hypothetical protein [Bacteroidales bacterium]MBN2755544.1 hypothetical protein [Bacteroidales bacterium]
MTNNTLTFLIIFLVILVPAHIIVFWLIFKKTINYTIGMIMSTPIIISIIVAYIVGAYGIINLFWAVPVVVFVLQAIYIFMNKKVGTPLKELKEQMVNAQKGNLNIAENKVILKFDNELSEMAATFYQMINHYKKIVNNVQNAAVILANVSNELQTNSQEMSNISAEQAASFEEVASTIEQILSNTKLNTTKAHEAGKIVNKTVNKIELNNTNVEKSVDSLNLIAQKINIINDIAFQTNILSLNAAVEAANAGEYGKGFSVVAKEVGNLAEKSKISASEIQEISNKSTKIASETKSISKEIVPEIKNTSKVIQEIILNNIEQERSAEQINLSISELNNSVQKLAGTSEETAANAEELAEQASQLRKMVNFFKV